MVRVFEIGPHLGPPDDGRRQNCLFNPQTDKLKTESGKTISMNLRNGQSRSEDSDFVSGIWISERICIYCCF